jgi:hypothetical protein
MPTIMTPTITTRRKKHFPSQQYTGTLFLLVDILIEYGPYSEILGDIEYGYFLHSASHKGWNSFFRTVHGCPQLYSVQGPIYDRNLQNFMKLDSFVIYGIPCNMATVRSVAAKTSIPTHV